MKSGNPLGLFRPVMGRLYLYLLNEMKFLVPNSDASRTLDYEVGGYRPQIPVLCPLTSTEFVEPSPPNKIPGYATVIA